MHKYTIIVAGGSGQRMKSALPKQFIEIAGRPVLMHTIEKFHKYDPQMPLVIVLPEIHMPLWKGLCLKHHFSVVHQVTSGGETRFHSVQNGLDCVPGSGLVAIHDGVRPLVSLETIGRCFDMAAEKGNAIPCIPVHETVRQENGIANRMIDRSHLRLIQTPQVFSIALLKKAYEQSYNPGFTDDASVLESIGEKIILVEGNRENIKVTEPVDLIFAKGLLGV